MRKKTNTMSTVAVIFGSLLITLEIYRRFGQWNDWIYMLDDFAGGAFLIITAIKFKRVPARYLKLLVAAWAIMVGGFFYSILGSVEVVKNAAMESTGRPALPVLIIKMILFLVVLINLFVCIRHEPNE